MVNIRAYSLNPVSIEKIDNYSNNINIFIFPKRMKIPFLERDTHKISEETFLFKTEEDSLYVEETFNKLIDELGVENLEKLQPIDIINRHIVESNIYSENKNGNNINYYSLKAEDFTLGKISIPNTKRIIDFIKIGDHVFDLGELIVVSEHYNYSAPYNLSSDFIIKNLFNENGFYTGPKDIGFSLKIENNPTIKSLNGLRSVSSCLIIKDLPNLDMIEDLSYCFRMSLKNTPKLLELPNYEGEIIELDVGSYPFFPKIQSGKIRFTRDSSPARDIFYSNDRTLDPLDYNWRKYIASTLDLSIWLEVISDPLRSSILFDFEKDIINKRLKGEEVDTELKLQKN